MPFNFDGYNENFDVFNEEKSMAVGAGFHTEEQAGALGGRMVLLGAWVHVTAALRNWISAS